MAIVRLCLCKADYALYTEILRMDHTAQGALDFTGSLEVSCTIDANFSSRRVWCTPVLKGGLGSGKWTTHFLVLEEVVDPVKESVEGRQQRKSGNGEKTAVAVNDF